MDGLSNENFPNQGIEKGPFQVAANRLEINENVNRAQFQTLWLTVNNRRPTPIAKALNE